MLENCFIRNPDHRNHPAGIQHESKLNFQRIRRGASCRSSIGNCTDRRLEMFRGNGSGAASLLTAVKRRLSPPRCFSTPIDDGPFPCARSPSEPKSVPSGGLLKTAKDRPKNAG